MNNYEKETFAKLIIETLTDGKDTQHIIAILNSFDKIEFGDKKELALSFIDNLQNSPNNDVKTKATDIITKRDD